MIPEPYGDRSLASPHHAYASEIFSPCSASNLVVVLPEISPPNPLRTPQQSLPPRYSSKSPCFQLLDVKKPREIDPLFTLIRFHILIFLMIS
jgi:hypothetical protein